MVTGVVFVARFGAIEWIFRCWHDLNSLYTLLLCRAVWQVDPNLPGKGSFIKIDLPEDLSEIVTKLANKKGTSTNEVVHGLIHDGLEAFKKAHNKS